ncbi:MAG: hypothetical protein K8F35_07775 [Dokdonella sp.]|uniref:hypothetical protein n=1 Tax=Dokdonella sp. TaxID=2291710 RepID=UPI0025BEBF9A|nr:hypothetical protein [Dokdonella sp.]MBZ0222914.1 hypothetical protein [Dokdonella sp.]
MNIELKYTALAHADERRVRLAANALAAHHLVVHASDWNGGHCDVLVTDSRDRQGALALERARLAQIPTLDVCARDNRNGETGASVVWLVRSLHRLLREQPIAAGAEQAAGGARRPGLVELVIRGDLAGQPVLARHGSISVGLLPRTGRVLSHTLGDALHARSHLGAPGWQFQALKDAAAQQAPGEILTSLDTFFMEGAWRARTQLPRFADGQYRLRDWPDLGSATELIEVLPIVRALLRERAGIADIARSSRRSEQEVSACLWALAASNILLGGKSGGEYLVQAPAPARRNHGMWSRLAIHFGLTRSG